ncbi:YbbR-like protein [Clostridium puniceum]|uniref:YbbR-like protein n=1 Tax=Clostridium puniceum TaxID=29367 RepID=A0A1S8TXS6_9CLOT|nr:CdaR family protein [Clostridium puniceum]OOM82480.1 YbbR-like protein [Clostridium puniceum]
MDKGEGRTLIVKIICVLLSLGLWLYISIVENPLRTYELKNIPVELINQESLTNSKFTIVNKQQFTVDLKLEGPSSEVAKVKKEDFKIVADISAYALKNGENTIPVQIISYPENINIKNNGFLGIKVNLEELVKKEFTIKSKVKTTFKENIYEKEQSISPSKVTVTGGKSSIDKISEAILTGEEKDIDKNIRKEYEIKFVDSLGNEIGDVEADNKTSQLSITIINGKVVPINLKTVGRVSAGFKMDGYELSKNSINIIGDSQSLEKIQAIDTEFVDMSSLQEDHEFDTKLNIPEGISVQNGENSVKVKIKVSKEENVTKNLVCNVQYINLNEGLLLESSKPTVNVTLTGTQTAVDKVSSENIKVILDLSNVKEEGTFDYTPQATLVNANDVTISSVGSANIVVKKKA